MSDSEKEYKKQTLQATFAVSFYMAVSIGLVFLNRIVLTDKKEKAGALFVSWFQFLVAYIIMIIITNVCPNVPLLNLFPKIHYKFDILIKVLPVSITYLLMIGFNNKCLEYVSVSGYQIVRSLSIMFNIFLSYFFLSEKTSIRACLACVGVLVGFGLGIEGEVGLTLKGIIFGIASSFFVALYSIIVKRVMALLDNNEYLLIEYNTPIAILMLLPFVWYSGEFEVLSHPRSLRFWGMQTFAGVVGFIMNIAIFLNIKYSSPLTHNLSGIVKACLQTFLAFLIFQDEVMTSLKFVGTIMVIGFSAYYAYVRKAEMKKKFEMKQLQEENEKKDELPLSIEPTDDLTDDLTGEGAFKDAADVIEQEVGQESGLESGKKENDDQK